MSPSTASGLATPIARPDAPARMPAAPRTTSPRREWIARIALLATTLAVMLVAGEAAVRVAIPQDLRLFDAETFRRISTEPGQMFEMIPGGANEAYVGVPVHIDALGFRDHEIAIPKPPGTVRVLALGDSVTFGYGVRLEDTFAKRLERMLNERATGGRRYEVVNAGVEGAGLAYYRRAIETWAGRLEPDLVLVGVVLNDVSRYVHLDTTPEDATLPSRSLIRRGHGALLRHSELYLASYLALRSIGYRTGFLDLRQIYGHSFLALEPASDGQTRAWRESLVVLDQLAALSRQRGLRLAFALFPMEPQISTAARDFYTRDLRLDLSADALDGRPQRALAAAAAAHGIPVLDLLPAFRRGADRPLFLSNRAVSRDPVHPSAFGHQVAADEILRFIDPMLE